MNTKQAKQLDFPMLLERMGYHPIQGGIKKGGNDIWYQSPLNTSDKTASFHVSRGSKVAWVFKCFSTGAEGTVIDFVIAHEGYASNGIREVLSFLSDKFPGSLFEQNKKGRGSISKANHSFSFHEPPNENQNKGLAADRELEYVEDLPLRSGKLLDYLEKERKIPRQLSQKYLRLVRYKNLKNGKAYYSIGMKNRAGGFEIRAGSDTYSFKSALIARDISIIDGSRKSQSVLVFEGMTDFLSFLVMDGRETPTYDVVIMHSINSYKQCKLFIDEQAYQIVHTFLDNDNAGRKYDARFQNDFGDRVISHSDKFQLYKDLNNALKEGVALNFFPNSSTHNMDYDIS
jgi:DNA primase (bacterial type)